ncbi:MAG: hypothetical protein IJ696_00845 [Ruminococcus sp.]|nr:hypothetical protein [Ruminococcus sp.]
MKIDQILNQMDQLLDEASSFPFTNKKQIDAEQMREYIDTLRMNLPGELQRARDTEENKKQIIADANKQAEDIINAAKAKAQEIVSEQEILKEAEALAEEKIREANERSEQIVLDAIDKDTQIRQMLTSDLDRVLTNAEDILTQNLEDVRKTKEAVIAVAAPKNN